LKSSITSVEQTRIWFWAFEQSFGWQGSYKRWGPWDFFAFRIQFRKNFQSGEQSSRPT